MTRLDFSPLLRATVGFDRLMRQLEDSKQWGDGVSAYPPYNIDKTDDDHYRISVAVAGFGESELSVEARESVLTIEGRKAEDDAEASYLYRGIAGRSFKREFRLADHINVVGARLKDGLLAIDLVREVPEAMKPRQIAISTGAADTPKIEKAQKAA